jgi:penicillin-binding protein 1A
VQLAGKGASLARFETEPFAVRARNSGVSPIFFDPNALLETDPDLERWCIWGARLRRSRMTKLHAPPSQRSRDEPVSQADCPEAEPLADAKAAGMGEATPHTGMAGPALLHAIRLHLLAFGQNLPLLWASVLACLRRSRARGENRTRARRPWRGGLIVPMLTGLVVAPLVIMAVITTGILWALHDTPVAGKAEPSKQPPLLLEAADGRPLGRTGPLIDAAARADFPDVLVNAVLSIEDRRFYQHLGVDPLGILRAARVNLGAGEIVEGGSTITQQLAKLRLVGRERTFERKLREAFAALWLDFRLEKDEILTEYLNRVYLGAGAYGVSAGARVYFGKRPADLSVAEAAMLAGLIKAPSEYNPIRNPEAARKRTAEVLDAMVETGAIDAQTAAEAKEAPAQVDTAPQYAPATSWFADWIAKHEFPKLGGTDGNSIKVRTTLVPELQQLAERVVEEALKTPRRGGPSQAALVAMRPDGAVLAMVGGRDYESHPNAAWC